MNPNQPQVDPKKRQYEFIEKTMRYHTPHGDQAERMEKIRQKTKELMTLIVDNSEASAEQTLALRACEQASMMAIKGIVVNETEKEAE